MDADEFDSIEFEQRLTGLKDTQDSIQTMSAWCLKNRTHHKKIVSSWLNVLKQVKVEHRLTLFHLANDVIQHSKRKNYEFVDSWGTTLQKATTMVRDEKVKNKIIRIFNIWDQRAVYNEEFLTDLHNLISINPINQKQQQVESDDEQQATIISEHIRTCVRNEKETDKSFKSLLKAPLCDTDNIHSLKDRKHVEDVKRDIDNHVYKLEHYIRTLNTEIKARTILISVLEQTDAFYHNQKGEVKVVANAYRNFGNRIKTMKRKLDELCTKLPSPIPSPDINAPSPEPDNDFDLIELSQNFLNKTNNGFLSFADSGNLPFNINDFKTESPKTDAQPIQVIGSSSLSKDLNDFNIDDFFKSMMPGSYSPNPPQPVPPVSNDYSLPSMYSDGPRYTSPQQNMSYRPPPPQPDYRPPMPPNNPYNLAPPRPSPNNHYGGPPNQNFNPSFNSTMSNYPHPPRPRYPVNQSNFNNHMPLAPPPVPPVFDGNLSDEYTPDWDLDMSWNPTQTDSFNQTIETPVSPPHFEREGRSESVVEYIDRGHGSDSLNPSSDVDHRQLRLPKPPVHMMNQEKVRSADVDHRNINRNLISLTGSPRKTDDEAPSKVETNLWKSDMDFRKLMQLTESIRKEGFPSLDSDYRVNPNAHQQSATTPHKPGSADNPTLPPPQINRMDAVMPKDGVSNDGNKTGETSNTILHGFTSPPPALQPATRLTTSKANIRGVRKSQNGNDNVESIDMEMSDEDFDDFPDFSDPFEDEDSLTKYDENSNNAEDTNETSNENPNNQPNNPNSDQSQDQSIPKANDADCISSQNQKDPISQLQFRPVNMFNSPPPGFIRPPPGPPPLMNPNFFPPPNRFWGNSPGMNGMNMNQNMNQNKMFQSSNRWNAPPNFDRQQRFNRPSHPDFQIESRPNRNINDNEDIESSITMDDPIENEQDNDADDNVESDDPHDTNDDQSNQTEQSTNDCTSAPKRQNPFSQIPRMGINDESDVRKQQPNTMNSRPIRDNMEPNRRSNVHQPNSGMLPSLMSDGPETPPFNPSFNNQSFNNPPFNNQIGPFNQAPGGPQPLFSPQNNMNFNSGMRGRGGGMRGDGGSPYFRPRGRGGPGPGMNMNRGNFRPNFRGNMNRGKW